MERLSRRLHQKLPPAARPGGPWDGPPGSKTLQPRRVAKLLPEDAAYLAGLIDGEGTIALSRRHAGDNRQLVLTISSTEVALVRWAQTTLGVGKITRKATTASHHAPGLTYCVANRQALDVLAQVATVREARKRFEAAFASLSVRRASPCAEEA